MYMFFFKCHYTILRNLLAVCFGHKPHFASVKEGYPQYRPTSIGKNASYAGLPVFVENEWQRTTRLIGVIELATARVHIVSSAIIAVWALITDC